MAADSPQTCTQAFTDALVRRDMPAALALLSEEVVFFYSNGSAIRGKDAFAALMTASWRVVEDYVYDSAGYAWVAQTDDAAAVIYSFTWSGRARGSEVSGSGRGTRVFRRDPAAGWLIVHEHLSTGDWTG